MTHAAPTTDFRYRFSRYGPGPRDVDRRERRWPTRAGGCRWHDQRSPGGSRQRFSGPDAPPGTDEDAGICPTTYKLWARGVDGAYCLACEITDPLK